ncbi:MAG: ABC transporter permease [Anaerolineae bacterium]|nr:ABC transporter permease [Anaerolineae bacterium]MCB9130401.1 ABC transporter permease [Anaerolineales bacterium]MCB0244598.1 ABC transporter permease [Anaerolineae bacterium]MCB0249150.1 ABC transporter permease [Anaerolineae bacterium]MCB9142851.1 ABC transporter permease [Anaerolineales bacterium]
MEQTLRRNPALRAWLLIAPAGLFLLIFFILPLFIVIIYGFLERGTYGGVVWQFTAENFSRVFDSLYFSTFLRSLYIAVLTTLFCILVGYPLAYFMTSRPPRQRNLLLLLLMIPFWTNFLIRTYAWLTLLRTNTGLINVTLMNLGIIKEPLPLFGNDFAIVLGLVYGWLPVAVLPMYASLDRLDRSLVEAARDLYASGGQVFRRVIWPLSLPGVVAGSMLVFIPSLGAFVTPAILGGGKSLMIGNVISNQFLAAHDWPFGSALSTLMMVIMLFATLLYFRSTALKAKEERA